ncbi:hypothetical protein [Kingella oralis]|uniref:hypothetical protein n=1 Tax=Kingella oralis TaxID=505 RepID=UPI003C6F512B
MLGIAVLFFLALWFIIVCLAPFLPFKLIKNKLVACIVAFMLTFGCWWLYLTIDGYRAYLAGKEACKQANLTIYVQPEKWREMVGGHDAWLKLADYEEKSKREISEEEKQKYPQTLNFEGVEYHFDYLTHKRVLVYDSGYYAFNSYAYLESRLYYDWETKTVLYKYTWFLGNYSLGFTASNLLGIRHGYKMCEPGNISKTYENFFYLN